MKLEDVAYLITPENVDKLSYITGRDKSILRANPNWVVYRLELNLYRWYFMPIREFQANYPNIQIQKLG